MESVYCNWRKTPKQKAKERFAVYEVHFRRDIGTHRDYTMVGVASTIKEAEALRKVSGDLVVHACNHQIVLDPGWLWGWEKDQKAYAYKALEWQRKNKFVR